MWGSTFAIAQPLLHSRRADKSHEHALEKDFFTVTPEEADARDKLRVKVAELVKTGAVREQPSEYDLLRLLRARSLKVDKAVVLLMESEKDRNHYSPVLYEDVCDLFSKGLASVSGFDNKGRPTVVVDPDKFRKGVDDAEHIMKFIIFVMDKAIELAQGRKQEQIVLLFDLTRFSMLSMDYEVIRKMLHTLMSTYPERVYRLIVYNPPRIFTALWAVVKPWLDENSLRKFHILRTQDQLFAIVDRTRVPVSAGGSFEYNGAVPFPVA